MVNRPVVGIVLLVALAGCGGKSSEPGPSSGPNGTTTATASLQASIALPTWSLGQTWTYAVEIPGLPTTRFKMMVAESQDDLWIVAADNRTQALHHAVYSTNPVLGRITKVGLSPYQLGEPVEMFVFPLTDRKTWTATLFGESMTFSALYDEAIPTLPDVYLPGFQIEARGASGARVVYNFVEAVQWFSDFQYHDASGTKAIHLSLEAFDAGHRGAYHFLRGSDLSLQQITQSTLTSGEPQYEVAAEDGFGALAWGVVAEGTGDQQAILNLTLKGPGDAVAWQRLLLLAPQEIETALEELPIAEGVWSIEAVLVGSAHVETRAVGLRITEGTL